MINPDNSITKEQKKRLPSDRTIERIAGWRQGLLRLLSWGLRLWFCTLRFKMSPATHQAISNTSEPQIILVWHNRLFAAAAGYLRYRKPQRKMYGLISASRDGAWLEAFLATLGIGALRGSSSWRATEVVREAIHILATGHDLVITPDGPRGPCYDMKAGPVRIAQQAQVPVLLVSGRFERAWRLKSWDQFCLPWPFSKLIVEAKTLSQQQLSGHGLNPAMTATELRQAMLAITHD